MYKMQIGFDAKRAYQNNTGLGHYSRTLITSLATYFPNNNYYLFAPTITSKFDIHFNNIHPIQPKGINKILKSTWRSNWVKKDLIKNNIQLYHGLSHEIPININKTKIKSVVTIHDLIFERYPNQYNKLDVQIYKNKFRYACKNADKIIAISNQTKQDIIDFYKIKESKIEVCYQSCNPIFKNLLNDTAKENIRQLYHLPKKYFLYVGSIIERKNLLTICKALKKIKNNIPLVVIGNGKDYKQKVKNFVVENNLIDKIIFLSEMPSANLESFKSVLDFPAIYQMATALIYPSIFEGFGIPVLEALCSGTPVITSNVSCMPEVGGDAAIYISPFDEISMANAMDIISTNENTAIKMKQKGMLFAEKFLPKNCAQSVINVYKELLT